MRLTGLERPPRSVALRLVLLISGVALLVWWPLSHWFWSDGYHRLLGFDLDDAPEGHVKLIGTTGLLPVAMLLIAAADPWRYRRVIAALILFAFALSATFLHLVWTGLYPSREVVNVVVPAAMGLLLLVLFPRRP
jgi:hypothetical protein